LDANWLDRYIDAWRLHAFAAGPGGADAMRALLGFMSDDVRYEDVPSGGVYIGHTGIAEMCGGAYQMSSDITFDVVTRQTDGRLFAFETLCRGTNTGAIGPIPATGRPIELRGTSIGSVSADGLVEDQRDYWDLAGLLVQLGAMPMPAE